MQNPFEENTTPLRPTFLTILCSLTLIWNFIGFYNGTKKIITAETIAARKDQIESMFEEMMSKYSPNDNSSQAEQMQASLSMMLEEKNIIDAGIANVISSALLILGGLWMWRLRKIGFYVYIAGNASGVLAPIILMVGPIGWAIGIMSLVNAVLFTGLYSIHLKYFS
jgi:hypothetical protein